MSKKKPAKSIKKPVEKKPKQPSVLEQLRTTLGEDKTDDAIMALIDAKPSDDNNEQGKIVQLLKGLAFNDSPDSTKFMKKLTSLISQENFGDLTK